MDVATHFSASKWAALTEKFSNPEKWFYFRVAPVGSKKSTHRIMVRARSLREASERVLDESNSSIIWYQQTDSKFKPLNNKKINIA